MTSHPRFGKQPREFRIRYVDFQGTVHPIGRHGEIITLSPSWQPA